MTATYFTPEEFACKCGRDACEAKGRAIRPDLLRRLDTLRYQIGHPLVVSSGLRCPWHNEKSGGKPNSAHLEGWAADLVCISDEDRWELTCLASKEFKRIGVALRFIHVDCDPTKPQERLWLY